MMSSEENLQLCFKEFIKTDLYPKGIDKARKTPDYVCDLFIHEPQNIEETQLGTLFMLGKIEKIPENKYRNFDFLLSLLISVIKREFYSDSKRPTSEALESSLNKANLYLADFTEKGNVEWIGNLNFICGAFSQNTLHITQAGEAIIKLFRERGVSHIENKFPTQRRPHPLKTFGNIASGRMLNNDKIVLGSKNVLNITSLTSLKQLSKEGCHKIIENLKILAERKVNERPVICLALEATAEIPEKITSAFESASQSSAQNINVRVKQARSKVLALKALRIMRRLSIIIFLTCRRVGLAIYKTISFIVSLFKKLSKIKLFRSPLRLISEASPLRRIEARIGAKLKISATMHSWLSTKWGKTKNNYYLLKQNKPAFFVVSLLAILILILPFVGVQKINYYIKINHFNELSTEIEEIQKKADAALIYSEKEKAKGLLQRNQSLLANLLIYLEKTPLKNNSGVLNKATILQGKHQEQQDSINNVKRIKELESVLNFSESGFLVNPIGLTKIGDNLYFFELESGILYKFNLATEEKDNPPIDKTGLTLVFISAKDELRQMVQLENGRIVLFGQSGKIYLYNSNTNDHITYSIDPLIPVEKIGDVKNFFSTFYILDIEQGNIVKYSPSQITEGVIKGNNWLSGSPASPAGGIEELKNARSMAIDGSIYILGSDDLITRYYRGKKTEDIKPLLEKPLAGNNKIFIGFDLDNFYLSDPKNKRLVVLNKEGKIINQYVNDELANLKDFWVTKDEKEVYLLCGKKVYRIEL